MNASARLVAAAAVLCMILPESTSSQPFWQKTSGPVGVAVSCLSFGPTGTLYAGTLDGCLYQSTNGGGNWSLIFTSGSSSETPLTGIVETGGYIFVGTSYDGIKRSSDGGATWVAKTNGFQTTGVKLLAINPQGVLFAAATSVYSSTDFGESWQNISAGLPQYLTISGLLIHPTGDLLALTSGSGVFRSSDIGATWSAVPGTSSRTITAVGFPAGGAIFAGDAYLGILRSTDNGVTWVSTSNGVTTKSITAFVYHQGTSTLLVGTADQGVYKWNEGSQSWSPSVTGLGSPLIGAMVLGTTIVAGTSGNGIYVSSDAGASWTQRNTGVGCTVVNAIQAANDNSLIAGTKYGGLYRSTNKGDSWTEVSNSIPKRTVIGLVKAPNGTLYAGVTGGGIYRSSDNGSTWSTFGTSQTMTGVTALAVNPSEHMFVGTTRYLYRSTNGGSSWDEITVGVANVFMNGIAVAPNGHVFISGTFGPIYRSTDNGGTWKADTLGFGGYTAIPISINAQGILFCAFMNSVYRSTNDGDQWTKTATLPGTMFATAQIRNFSINPDGKVFAATSVGVFRSTDDGVNWTKTNDGLTDSAATSLGFTADGTGFVGSTRQGVFRTSKTTTSTHLAESETPAEFRLEQNYPNPFNGISDIGFRIAKSAVVKLQVFDLLGREVALLVNERKEPGRYEVGGMPGRVPAGSTSAG